MDTTPVEIVSFILRLFSEDQSALSVCARVCHTWRIIVLPMLYYAPDFELSNPSPPTFLPRLDNRAVRSVPVRDDVYLSSQDPAIAHIASTLGSTLTHLSLAACRVTDVAILAVAILAVAAHCSHLIDLDISGLDITDLSISEIALHCPLLERLIISCWGCDGAIREFTEGEMYRTGRACCIWNGRLRRRFYTLLKKISNNTFGI
ncbi:hypothetical protein BC937DRAFT_94263 [Endogone sp. FLAS-F59071]|nr:hypothetical protein BC937DRAFT_94263 [Endogone sp. FLAS-F59071]|eukprot:RUS14157.1 hypothetical protein BC937DRAFT_94263 [Endogone sp. FLAS-F59071]